MNIQQEYKKYLEECTKCSNTGTSAKYMVFNRVNKTIATMLGRDSFDLYSCTEAAEFEQLLEKLFDSEEFKVYNKKGKEQYSTALRQYLYFLRARQMFSKECTSSEQDVVTVKDESLQQIFYGAPWHRKVSCCKSCFRPIS